MENPIWLTMLMPYKDLEIQREYQRNWRAARREEFFRNKSCVECGSGQHLELDHIDPIFKADHRVWTWSAARRQSELIKCQILCARCHLAKTLERRRKTQHGAAGMYQDHGCRCARCKAWKLAASRRGNEKRKLKLGPVGSQVEPLPHGLVS